MPGASIFRRERPISTISGTSAVDIAGSVAREVEEETGLTPADYRAGAHWDCVVVGAAIAMIRILDVDLHRRSAARQDRGQSRAAAQPELSAIHLVREHGRFHGGDAALCDCVYRVHRSADVGARADVPSSIQSKPEVLNLMSKKPSQISRGPS